MDFWYMTIGDELNAAINNIPSRLQRLFFQSVLERYNKYIEDTDDVVTFGEYYNSFNSSLAIFIFSFFSPLVIPFFFSAVLFHPVNLLYKNYADLLICYILP